jgi:FMN phosphatase YigB (HAD superfamily)
VIFLDLDGVLADFDKARNAVVDESATDEEMWKVLDQIPNWFLTLELMPKARKLWDYCNLHWPGEVSILTALPKRAQKETAARDKRKWVKKHFGSVVPVITCYRIDKQKWAGERHILIDDSGVNIGQWIKAGGKGILHHNVDETIAVLKELK